MLTKGNVPGVIGALKEELAREISPYFLQRLCHLSLITLEKVAPNNRAPLFVLRTAINFIDEVSKNYPIPERDPGPFGAIARICGQSTSNSLDPGLVHGVFLEVNLDMTKLYWEQRGQALQIWTTERERFIEKVLQIPNLDFSAFDTLHFVVNDLHRGFNSILSPTETKLITDYFGSRIVGRSVRSWLRELLESWCDQEPSRFWILLSKALTVSDEKFLGTKILLELLVIRPRDGDHLYDVAQKVLLGKDHPVNSKSQKNTIAAATFEGQLLHLLKEEMTEREARRALIRWIQFLPQQFRLSVIVHLALTTYKDGPLPQPVLDERSQTFIEELLGAEGWQAVCAYQDSSMWDHWDIKQGKSVDGWALGREMVNGLKKDTLEYKTLKNAINSSRVTQHDCQIAEAFEDLIAGEKISAEEAESTLEECLDILSGDLVVVVSHLRDEWMAVRRSGSEFAGGVFPCIEIAKHRQLGDDGAACRFRIPLKSDPKKVLRGRLSSEGELTLDNTPLFDRVFHPIIRAAVAESVCEMLVPRLTAKSSTSGARSGVITTAGSATGWSSRPQLEIMGELGSSTDRDVPKSQGRRLNSNIAIALFRWLTGEDSDHTFRLFVESNDGDKEKVFIPRPGIKELLLRKQLGLELAYIRAVRAHTQPTGAYLTEEGKIRARKMSSRAESNYKAYRAQGGRELTFSSVQKTYKIPDGTFVPVEVPRTFNNGSFVSLQEVYELITDHNLKEVIERSLLCVSLAGS